LAAEIVGKIKALDPPGRFLEMQDNGRWKEVTKKQALEKASQAMREKKWNMERQSSLPEASIPPVSEALEPTVSQPSSGSSPQSTRAEESSTALVENMAKNSPAPEAESRTRMTIDTQLQVGNEVDSGIQPIENPPSNVNSPTQQQLPVESLAGGRLVPVAEVPNEYHQRQGLVENLPGEAGMPVAESPDDCAIVLSPATTTVELTE
jgi:hypothetical protein